MAEELDKGALIAKIQKLLNLANGTNFDGEKEAAQEKVAMLMASYAISMSEVLNTKEGYEEAFIRIDVEGMQDKIVNWEGSLASVIAHTFDSQIVHTWAFAPTEHNILNRSWRIAFLGMKSDLELATHFFKFLRRTVAQMSDKSFDKRADRTTYAYGLVTELGRRLDSIYKLRNEVSSQCRDLVVVKARGVDEFKHRAFPNLKKGRNITLRGSNEAYHKGRSDAHKVSLHRPISGSSHTQERIAS